MSGGKQPMKQSLVVAEQIDTSWFEIGKKVWIEIPLAADSKEDIFQQAILNNFNLAKNEATYTFRGAQGQKTCPLHQLYERADDYDNKEFKGFDDMVNMEIINDAELLVNLKIRYQKSYIYTYVGPTLLAVNPFQAVPMLFQPTTKPDYIGKIALKKGGHFKDLPPHIYGIGAEAYRCLFENDKNQSIVISGESGAGKTENAKFCMNLLTSIGQFQLMEHDQNSLKVMNSGKITKSSQDIKTAVLMSQNQVGIEEKILSCNPILESFGNSKTLRNNNSSRFGKYVKMMVLKTSGKIKGAEIINYLLEKSRITSQGFGERNFHIFYFFMQGMTPQELEKYYLAENGQKLPYEGFRYLKNESGLYEVKGINDKTEFEVIQNSIQVLGLGAYFQSIFSMVAALLLLGNISFDDSTFGNETTCTVIEKKLVGQIAQLLKLDEKQVLDSLTMKQREVNKAIYNSPLTKQECQGISDTWAKEIYERLFNWLVEKLNETIQPKAEENAKFVCVGLLDIYGFEVLAVNGFEQMMINYTNERLHQLYILYVFKEEETIFVAEGLKQYCGQIKFTDNQAVMDLMDKYPVGIFDLIDESCQVKSDDEQLLQKIRKAHPKNPLLQNPKIISKPSFIVVHTAKDVEYSIMGFREKNKDELSSLTHKMSSLSKDELMAKLFRILPPGEEKKDKSLSKKLRSQMAELMKELNSCDVHFVRCIKPNDEKVKEKIVQDYTLKQIRYLGILDSLKVRKQNYPIRRAYQIFYKKYGDMTKNEIYLHLLKINADFKQLTIDMFKENLPQLGPETVLFGTKKIFIRLEAIPIIDKKFAELMVEKHRYATRLQKSWKIKKLADNLHKFSLRMAKAKDRVNAFRKKIYYKKKLVSCIKIQKWFKKCGAEIKRKKMKNYSMMIQKYLKRAFIINRTKDISKHIKTIQRFVRMLQKTKQRRKVMYVKRIVSFSIDQAWLVIQDKAAVIIQKYIRGHLTRKHMKRQVKQIKEAGRQCRAMKVSKTIQRHARGYLVRSRIKQMHKAAYYIQGYFRMVWLSDLFQLMRVKILIIQQGIRTFLSKRRAMNYKYTRYLLPLEQRFALQKTKEEKILFGTLTDSSPLNTGSQIQGNVDYDSYYSPFLHQNSPSKLGRNSTEGQRGFQHINREEMSDISSFEQILSSEIDPSGVNRKIKLFGFVLDLEIFADTSDYFPSTFSSSYKKLFEQSYTCENFLQTFHVGATHAFATSSSGKVYGWGNNDFCQLGIESLSVRPIKPTVIPIGGRVKQVETGADHTLFLVEDGTVLVCGSNEQGQLLDRNSYHSDIKSLNLPFSCKQIAATNHTSMILSNEGCVYTWPVSFEQGGSRNANFPFEIILPTIGTQIQYISTGNEFALLLSTSGQIYSFGENDHGELGLGDNQSRLEPTLITEFPKGQKISQISCGFKHCIAKTTLGKMYIWGWGEFGQLGTDSFQDKQLPKQLDIHDCQPQSILQVQAGYRTTVVLVENKKLYWCGTNGTISYQSEFCQVRLQAKCQVLKNSGFAPIRIMTSYSRTLSLIHVTFANYKEIFKGYPGKARGVLQTLSQKWLEIQPLAIDPPYIESISKYFQVQHMKIPVKGRVSDVKLPYQSIEQLKAKSPKNVISKSARILSPQRSPKSTFNTREVYIEPLEYQSENRLSNLQSQTNDYEQQSTNRNDSQSPFQNYMQKQMAYQQQYQSFSNPQVPQTTQSQPIQPVSQSPTTENYQNFLQMEQIQRQQYNNNNNNNNYSMNQYQNPTQIATNNQMQSLNLNNYLSQPKEQDAAAQYQKEDQASKKQPANQKQTSKFQSQTQIYNHDRLLNRLKGQYKQPKQINKKAQSPRATKQDVDQQQNNNNREQIPPLQNPQLQVQNEEELDTESKYISLFLLIVKRIRKLREIKQRLISLKGMSETKWTQNDHEFLRTIYKSNLSVLLDQLSV